MRCPFCKTENRDDRDTCYSCEKDLSMLRLIVQKARAHFNAALEYAERGRDEEAIAELNHALELDRTHINSHIVLGTIHARLGDMDKAQQHWRQALDADPRFLKAHEYLEKLETGRKNLPVVRRQRFYIITLGVFLTVLGALAIVLFARNMAQPSSDQLQLAWGRYQEKNDIAALSILEKIPKQDKENPVSGQAALLADMIRRNESMMLNAAQKYLARYDLKDIALADKQIDALMERKLPRDVERRALQLKERLLESSQGAVATALDLFRDGRTSEETVVKTLDAYEQIAEPKDEFLDLSRKTLASYGRNRDIQNVIDRFRKQQISRMDLLENLNVLRKKYPDYRNLDRVVAFYAAPEQKTFLEVYDKAIKAGDFGTAAESLNSLQNLWQITGNKDSSKQLAELHKRMEESRVDKMLADVKAHYNNGDYEKTVEVAEASLAKPIDNTSRASLQTLLDEVNIKLADQRWQWMRGLDRNYIDGRISIEEAEKTARFYPQIKKYLSRKNYPNIDDDMLFYLAMAYRRINQPDKAQAAFEDIKKQYPKSAFRRWVKHYEDFDAKAKGKSAEKKS